MYNVKESDVSFIKEIKDNPNDPIFGILINSIE